MDAGVYATALRLKDELALALSATRAGAVCAAMVHPGDSVPMYGCAGPNCTGSAFVRVASIQPFKSFPVPLAEAVSQKECGLIEYGATYELLVDRCYPNTPKNEMPSIGRLDSAARDAIDDAAAMRKAIASAFGPSRIRYVPGPWTPRGASGGIHGGSMTVIVNMKADCGYNAEWPQLDERTAPLSGDPRFP